MEKWWPGLEQQYRLRGDTREADAIRACRLLGGAACERILTITEVHALLELANAAGGDPAKIQEGLDKSPLLAGLALVREGAKVAPRGAPTPTPPQLGLVVLLYMLSQYQSLRELDRFQETLTRFDYVILDSPQAVYCQGCHPVPVAPLPQETEFEWDWWDPAHYETDPLEPAEASNRRNPRDQRRRGFQPMPDFELPPGLELTPQQDCQRLTGGIVCSDLRSRDDIIRNYLDETGWSPQAVFDCGSKPFDKHRAFEIDQCGGAPAERWHCQVSDPTLGQSKLISLFGCFCCLDDGAPSLQWERPHDSAER